MLILGVDTSGKHGSIALVQCEARQCPTIEIVSLQGGTFSAQLVPQIAALLENHGFTKNNIDGFAVVSGPGSFTGLRVGLAAIKGLAEVLGKPIAAVSLLEALAVTRQIPGKVLCALDAGRGQIYVGEYEVLGETARCVREELLTQDELAGQPHLGSVITPDPGIADALRAKGRDAEEVERPRSDLIAQIGWRKIQGGQIVAPKDLEANYIRRSDAEIFAKSS